MRINLLNTIKATDILELSCNEFSIKKKKEKKKGNNKKKLASVLKVNIMLTFPVIHKQCQNLLQSQ